MWIDTHCHLDAREFDADRAEQAALARAAGVSTIVVPSVCRANFNAVRALAHARPGIAYALGIHPLFTADATDEDLAALRVQAEAARDDPCFVGIGEIGLDYFVPTLDDAKQRAIFEAQLRLARDLDLPVICHVRRSQDQVLAGLRRFGIRQGIGHAFNGSRQQADNYIAQGFKLGFGGAMTFPRALQIRRLAASLPFEAIVVETDAPDIPPEWLVTPLSEPSVDDRHADDGAVMRKGEPLPRADPVIRPGGGSVRRRNQPDQIPRIAETLAELRGMTLDQVAVGTTANALVALPRLARLPR
ncbi:DNAase [Robbsia andropogonis]|uniref:DNAase n=1 Tax=Robbsia andropogonis TaxID=28092 RepID=A0A0F5JXC9_9BURK|nr:TatD family hydrolase [Robbsia andropogonis]KKB62493.1 DNAase [Robbsia andropogonis]MCP1120152.1 TatD family hydrolase [Robbsia andropogonis]MCP1130016.1 TatD family hydrolase [Robbsia andropogonis]